ncbi:selenocysteine insertion sequence-binding protein 2-like [Elysia marginata]|uniref:Selenocysteine insertion sequence-binding protein 2-like n=1 Tax=Elysia marginata TaxID=1093978 RepID=A0AAV4FBS5_9GAST|nr:selenocysteine insertion sequence-binding protein 2-like [Elysia marginata]
MVQAVEREVAEHPASQASSSIGGVPGLFAAHMGHSRTPSGCSAISFTSSVLSEPISENFPHAEPEVDSKGYEIVRDAAGNVVHSQEGTSKARSPNDIDDGNEADVEDLGEIRRKKRAGKNLNSVRFGSVGAAAATSSRDGSEEPDKMKSGAEIGRCRNLPQESSSTHQTPVVPATSPEGSRNVPGASSDRKESSKSPEINKSQLGAVTPESSAVSHIDSIHSRSYNLGEAILSQHTSLPNADVVSGSCSSQAVHNSSCSADPDTLHASTENLTQDKSGDDVDDDLRISAIDDDSNDDNYEDDEDEEDEDNENEEDKEENGDMASSVRSHQRIIDKERIKSWLESQTSVVLDD